MQKYWEDEAKTFNADSMTYLREIEVWIKHTVKDMLMTRYGAGWEVKGIPKEIYKKAKSVADDRNYDNIASGNETETIEIWDCVTLKECREIISLSGHWQDLFEVKFTRPEEARMAGGKAAKTKWIEQIESLQNKLNMASYSVSTADFDFIKAVYAWLKK